jgi:hypothetical protein
MEKVSKIIELLAKVEP